MIKKISIAMVLASVFGSSFSGGIEHYESTAKEPALSGFYGGIGTAFNSIEARYKRPVDGSFSDDVGPFTNHLNISSPLVQMGWWSKPKQAQSLSFGAKVLYKYIGAQTAGFHNQLSYADSADRIEQEFAILAMLKKSIGSNFSAYAGLGFVVFPSVLSTIINDSEGRSSLSHTLYGGIGELGLLYQMKSNCFLGLGYAYAVTGNKLYLDFGTEKKRTIQVINKQLMLSLNYNFK